MTPTQRSLAKHCAGPTSTTQPMTYLASPYSDRDPSVVLRRFNETCEAAAIMLRMGTLVFSPIAHSHSIALCGLGGSFADWIEFDQWFLERCDKLTILKLVGWQNSKGIKAEVAMARGLKKPITTTTLPMLRAAVKVR